MPQTQVFDFLFMDKFGTKAVIKIMAALSNFIALIHNLGFKRAEML